MVGFVTHSLQFTSTSCLIFDCTGQLVTETKGARDDSATLANLAAWTPPRQSDGDPRDSARHGLDAASSPERRTVSARTWLRRRRPGASKRGCYREAERGKVAQTLSLRVAGGAAQLRNGRSDRQIESSGGRASARRNRQAVANL